MTGTLTVGKKKKPEAAGKTFAGWRNKKMVSLRLSEEVRAMLDKLVEMHQRDRTTLVEQAIQEKFERESNI